MSWTGNLPIFYIDSDTSNRQISRFGWDQIGPQPQDPSLIFTTLSLA
jgi:hypothetical protein